MTYKNKLFFKHTKMNRQRREFLGRTKKTGLSNVGQACSTYVCSLKVNSGNYSFTIWLTTTPSFKKTFTK